MSLTIAAAQSTSVAGDIPRNVLHHLRFASLAAERGAHLVVFPELSLTGYELAIARSHPVRPDSPDLGALRRLAAQSRMTIVVGAPLANDSGDFYIGALALRPDGSVSTYSKVHVHESEQHVFTCGPGGDALRIEDIAVALAICADASHPQHAALAAGNGARVYATSVMITEDAYARKTGLLQGYARDHGMAVLMANYSGVTGGDESAGKSAIWSEEGRCVAASTGAEEALVIGTKENGAWSGVVVPMGG